MFDKVVKEKFDEIKELSDEIKELSYTIVIYGNILKITSPH